MSFHFFHHRSRMHFDAECCRAMYYPAQSYIQAATQLTTSLHAPLFPSSNHRLHQCPTLPSRTLHKNATPSRTPHPFQRHRMSCSKYSCHQCMHLILNMLFEIAELVMSPPLLHPSLVTVASALLVKPSRAFNLDNRA